MYNFIFVFLHLYLYFNPQSRTDGYFTFREIDRRDVAVVLAKSLGDLVDQSSPTTAIKWEQELEQGI